MDRQPEGCAGNCTIQVPIIFSFNQAVRYKQILTRPEPVSIALMFIRPCVCASFSPHRQKISEKRPMEHEAPWEREVKDQAAMSCLANATSIESPSWFRISRPESGISPEVDWLTAIFLAISSRQAI